MVVVNGRHQGCSIAEMPRLEEVAEDESGLMGNGLRPALFTASVIAEVAKGHIDDIGQVKSRMMALSLHPFIKSL